MFIKNAARMSYRQVLIRKSLEGEPVARFMNDKPATVSPGTTVKELVEEYVYRYHYKMYPVVDDGKLRGCVTLSQIKSIPRNQWEETTVADLSQSCDRENSISTSTDAVEALKLMNQTKKSRLLVVDGDRLVGIITLKDLLEFFSIKLDLEGEEGP